VEGICFVVGGRLQGNIGPFKYQNYQAAFYTAAALAVIALVAELLAKRPVMPEGAPEGAPVKATV
jgi:hypothetical protein